MEPARKRSSYAEYLAFEQVTEDRHEFFDGEILAMAGGTFAHTRIATNALLGLARLAEAPCAVFNSDLRIRIEGSGLATYPDASFVCDPRFHEEDPNAVVNPRVLVEVLSPSTRSYDLGDKFEHYRLIPSLSHVVYVEQDEPRVIVRERVDESTWRFRTHLAGDVVELGVLGSFPVDALYEGVPEPTPDEDAEPAAS